MEEITKLFNNIAIKDKSPLASIQKRIKIFLDCKKQVRAEYFNKDILNNYLENYIRQQELITRLNNSLINKKIRRTNFPSEVSENIAKYALFKKYKIMPNWDTKKGDLIIGYKRIEVKCFTSNGPISFGPMEEWDWLILVDGRLYKNKIFKIYKLPYSTKSIIWNNLKVNKKETIEMQCEQKRRPRITFNHMQEQLKDHLQIIFSGKLEELF